MIWLQAAAVFLLIVLNGMLSMSELAVVSSSKPRLKLLADRGSRGARVALGLIDDPGSFLSTVQIGITLIGVLTGAVGGATLAGGVGAMLNQYAWIAPRGEAVAMALVVVIITLLSIVIGELVPKQLALRNPERIAVIVAPPLRWLLQIARPAVQLLDVASRFMLKLAGSVGNNSPSITEEEVRAAIDEGARAGVLKQIEREMLSGVMRLADRRVELIMTELDALTVVDLALPSAAVWRAVAASQHTRLIAVRGDPHHVVGLLQTRDLLGLRLRDEFDDIAAILFHPPRVGLDLPATEALDRLRNTTAHMLFVVDQFDRVAGIVTVADILKAIIGDLGEVDAATPTMFARDAASWLIDGGMLIDVVSDRLGLVSLPSERNFDSLAGFLLWRLERLPEEGERVRLDGYEFEVVDMDGPRIDKVLVTRLPETIGMDDDLAGG